MKAIWIVGYQIGEARMKKVGYESRDGAVNAFASFYEKNMEICDQVYSIFSNEDYKQAVFMKENAPNLTITFEEIPVYEEWEEEEW